MCFASNYFISTMKRVNSFFVIISYFVRGNHFQWLPKSAFHYELAYFSSWTKIIIEAATLDILLIRDSCDPLFNSNFHVFLLFFRSVHGCPTFGIRLTSPNNRSERRRARNPILKLFWCVSVVDVARVGGRQRWRFVMTDSPGKRASPTENKHPARESEPNM